MKFFKHGPLLAAATVLLVSAPMYAAPKAGNPPQSMYNPSTETTITGTVEKVTAGPHGATHITLKTAQGSMAVMLGPTQYIQSKNFTLKTGDQVEVTGSKIMRNQREMLLAREVKKGGNTLTLRDASGNPQWGSSSNMPQGSTMPQGTAPQGSTTPGSTTP